jgi:thiol:disulfide interchange protein
VFRGFVLRAKRGVADASVEDIVAIALGSAFGALVAAPIAFIVSLVPGRLGDVVALVVAICIVASAVVVAQLRKHDLIDPWFRRGEDEQPAPAQSTTAPAHRRRRRFSRRS